MKHSYFVCVQVAMFLAGTTASNLLKFLDCPDNGGSFGIIPFRSCCKSEQLPNDCECFDSSRDSVFVNTVFRPPYCPDDVQVTFTLYTREDRSSGTNLRAGSPFPVGSTFDGSKPIKFLTHGFMSTIVNDWASKIKDAFLDLVSENPQIVRRIPKRVAQTLGASGMSCGRK